jgi:hypothetical protein
MTMSKLHPLIPPSESSGFRAKDTVGLPLLILPGERKSEKSKRDDKPWDYVDCRVIVLNDSGIEKQGDGVRYSWARALAQLEDAHGEWIAVRPVEDGNAIVLEELTGADLEVAERVLDELTGEGV